MKPNQGFTLIELMIVIAIISLLASLAIPTYENYIKRARFTEVVLATSVFKTAVALALQTGIDANLLENNQHGIPASPEPTANLDAITVEKGIIKATASRLLDHATYILKPDKTGSHWSIGGTCFKTGLCHATT